MLSNETVRKLNLYALILLMLPLIGAFGIQLYMHELPCPLCLLQRVGMLGVAVGLAMNLRFGIHPAHYGISIISAVIGAAVATRQILLHIVPTPDGVTGFGDPVLGLHLYTWSLIVFISCIIGIALLMALMKWGEELKTQKQKFVKYEIIVISLFLILALGNSASAYLECGFEPCPENPTEYIHLDEVKALLNSLK